MATKKSVKAAPDEVKEEVKIDLAGEAKSKKKYVPSSGPFAPRRDGDPFVPATRLEAFLFAIAIGDPDECPEPVTRIEYLLLGIAFAIADRPAWGEIDGLLLPDYSGANYGESLIISADGSPEWT